MSENRIDPDSGSCVIKLIDIASHACFINYIEVAVDYDHGAILIPTASRCQSGRICVDLRSQMSARYLINFVN